VCHSGSCLKPGVSFSSVSNNIQFQFFWLSCHFVIGTMNSRKVMTEALQAAQNCSPRLSDVCRNDVQVSDFVHPFVHLLSAHCIPACLIEH
jgi:hypothetical protein